MRAVVFLLALSLLYASRVPAELVDGIAAIVGDEIILLSQLELASSHLQKRVEL